MNQFITTDIALATYLSLQGFIIERIQKNDLNTRKKKFVFENKNEIEKEVEKFYNKEARVCPLRYYQELKIIKSRLYDENAANF